MRRTGVTLLEMLVVLTILGLIFAVSGLAFTSLRAPRESEWVRELRRARQEAIQTGQQRRAVVSSGTVGNGSLLPAPLFLPDGRALGTGVDPPTGAPNNAPR